MTFFVFVLNIHSHSRAPVLPNVAQLRVGTGSGRGQRADGSRHIAAVAAQIERSIFYNDLNKLEIYISILSRRWRHDANLRQR